MELRVRRITQFTFEKVISCFTMMTEKRRLKSSWEDSKRAEVETGRYEFPHEKKRLLNPNITPIEIERINILGVKSVKGTLLVNLKR